MATSTAGSRIKSTICGVHWNFARMVVRSAKPTPNIVKRKYGWSSLHVICDQAPLF
jgi:hypothetical protein